MKKYTLYKFKKGGKKIWEKWCKELIQREQEGLATLVEENLLLERCIIFKDYLFYEHITVPGKRKKKMDFQKQINQKHFKMLLGCLENGDKGVIGYTFEIINK